MDAIQPEACKATDRMHPHIIAVPVGTESPLI